MRLSIKNKTTQQTRNKSFDRRRQTRQPTSGGSLFCLYQGRQLELHTVEITERGARIIAPEKCLKSGRVLLTYRLARMEMTAEYRVVWTQPIVGGKVVAGLQCLSTSDRRAA